MRRDDYVRNDSGVTNSVPGPLKEVNGDYGVRRVLRERLTTCCTGKEMTRQTSMTDGESLCPGVDLCYRVVVVTH